jgi:hypothetical protein
VVDKVALGLVFSEYFDFPCQFSFHQLLPYSSVIRNWYNRPVNGRRPKWTQSRPTPRKQELLNILGLSILASSRLKHLQLVIFPVTDQDSQLYTTAGKSVVLSEQFQIALSRRRKTYSVVLGGDVPVMLKVQPTEGRNLIILINLDYVKTFEMAEL